MPPLPREDLTGQFVRVGIELDASVQRLVITVRSAEFNKVVQRNSGQTLDAVRGTETDGVRGCAASSRASSRSAPSTLSSSGGPDMI